MTLSVVMAVRDGEQFVRDAVESVLAQTVTDFEFLIVDDASRDATPRILCEYELRDSRITVLHNERSLGPYPSLNRALRRARGDVIARHDADDLSPPRRFAGQLAALASAPGVTLVTGAVEVFGATRKRRRRKIQPTVWQPRLEWELLFYNAVGAGGHTVFPRVVQGRPVFFSEDYPYAEDYALWCDLCRLGKVVCPSQVVYSYRRHKSSISSRKAAEQSDCGTKIRRAHQRRYLSSSIGPNDAIELTEFWLGEGCVPTGGRARHIASTFVDLRTNFLRDIARRHGPADSTVLCAEIDRMLIKRLGHLLLRSVWSLDLRAWLELMKLPVSSRMGGES